MSHFTRFALYGTLKLAVIAALLATAACAARNAAPPVAAAPAAAAPAETGPGITEQQPPPTDEDFVFVEKERKEAPAHDDTAPATSLHADQTARKQRVAR